MGFIKYLLPVLAVSGAVLAQNGCSEDTNTIQNQGDADALASCSTVEGDIEIDERVSGPISLDGIQQLSGNLVVKNAQNLSDLSANDLSSIGKSFILDGVQTLQTLNFPSLTEVDIISWRAVPELAELSFSSEVKTASEVTITNTGLTSLNGINLDQCKKFDVNNNRYLKKIELQLGNITEALNIQANGQGVEVSFPNLEWAFNMTFRECSSVDLPSLVSVNSTMGFFDNSFESIKAPNLTLLGKDLTINANDELTELDFPELKSINGGYTITNNTKLDKIEGFDALTKVGGAVTVKGVFEDVKLPKLDDVRGGFVMASTGDFDCTPFNKLRGDKIQGTYSCRGNADRSVATGTGTADSTSSPTNAANAQFAVDNVAMGFFSLFAAMLGLAI